MKKIFGRCLLTISLIIVFAGCGGSNTATDSNILDIDSDAQKQPVNDVAEQASSNDNDVTYGMTEEEALYMDIIHDGYKEIYDGFNTFTDLLKRYDDISVEEWVNDVVMSTNKININKTVFITMSDNDIVPERFREPHRTLVDGVTKLSSGIDTVAESTLYEDTEQSNRGFDEIEKGIDLMSLAIKMIEDVTAISK